MSPHDFDRWSAQEPPDDFADRVVRAMFVNSKKPARRGGWLGGLGLAAILLGATAFGMLGIKHGGTSVEIAERVMTDDSRVPITEGKATARTPAKKTPEPAREAARPREVRPPVAKRPVQPRVPGGREPMCHCESDLAVCGCLER